MPVISVFGPNAIGKSTALRRWAARYKSLGTFIDADLNLVLHNGEERKEKGWSGTIDEKRALITKYRSWPHVVVVATARTSCWLAEGDYVYIITCPWQLHDKHMRARCAARGKKFRDDYWTSGKLGYECVYRYTNFINRYVPAGQFVQTVIEDQARDWPKADEAFYALFRKVNNEMRRS